jgi:hypothetical protein
LDLKSQKNNLFKLYKRFHPHVSGKGLGLYLVKSQVEAMNGTISVESEPDKGARFRIVFTEPEEVTKQVFYDNEAVQLYYHGNLNIIVISWKRPVTSSEYHEVFEALVKSLNTYQSPGWISDVRKQGVISDKDQQWFGQNILPELVKSGFKRIAVVGMDAPERKQYLNYVQALADTLNFELRMFGSMDESLAWMETALRQQESAFKN